MFDARSQNLARMDLKEVLGHPNDQFLEAAGLRRADRLAPAGHYVRSLPCLINLDGRTPLGAKYRRDRTNTIQRYSELSRVVFAGAMVTGQGTLVTRNGLLIHDSCWEMLAQKVTPSGLERTEDGALAMAANPTRHITMPSLLLKRPWWRNYGHWLTDAAALLALVPGLAMPSAWQIVIGAFQDPVMRSIVYEMLETVAPGIPVLEHWDHETWSFDCLHYVSPVTGAGPFKLPQGISALRAHFLTPRLAQPPSRKLFISRGSEDRRRLVNEEAIAELCRERGFEVIRPERLSLKEQARAFQSADIVVGVKGAALTNLLFCTSSAAAVVLTPAGWIDSFFWDIAGQLGMDYFEIFGESTQQHGLAALRPFYLNPQWVTQSLDDLDAMRTKRAQAPRVGIVPLKPNHRDIDSSEIHGLSMNGAGGTVEPEAGTDHGQLGMLVHVSGVGDVTGSSGEWVGSSASDRCIEGFQVNVTAEGAEHSLAYQAYVDPRDKLPWVDGGSYCGTRHEALALRGFRVQLCGQIRAAHDCTYSGRFADGEEVTDVPMGRLCHSPTWSPLIAMRIKFHTRAHGRSDVAREVPRVDPQSAIEVLPLIEASAMAEAGSPSPGDASVALGQQLKRGPPPDAGGSPSLAEVMGHFLSLGDNCEFGLIQRRAGVEPVDLLRLAAFYLPGERRLHRLIEALTQRFAGLGELETITCSFHNNKPPGEFIIRESKWNLFYHTGRNKSNADGEKLRIQQVASLQLRVRKMLRDLELAQRILVWKSNVAISEDDVRRLVTCVRRFGPNLLLWVRTADDDHPVGLVEYLGQGLLTGYVSSFAPYAKAYDIDFGPWHSVCRNAIAIAGILRHCGEWSRVDQDQAASIPISADLPREPSLLRVSAEEIHLEEQRAAKVALGSVSAAGSFRDAKQRDTLTRDPGSRDVRSARLKGVVLDPANAVLLRNGSAIPETCFQSAHIDAYRGTQTAVVGLRAVASDLTAILGFNPAFRSYYHWLMQCLPAIDASMQRVGDGRFALVLPELLPWQEETLGMLGLNGIPRITVDLRHQYYLAQVHYCEYLNGSTTRFVSPRSRLVLDRLARHVEVIRGGPERLHVVRADAPKHRAANEGEVEVFLGAQGFVSVVPDTLSIADRVQLFRGARMIVGASSVALTNIAFCKPGTKILELTSSNQLNYRIARVAQAAGLNHHLECFDPVVDSNGSNHLWIIDVPRIARTLNLLAEL